MLTTVTSAPVTFSLSRRRAAPSAAHSPAQPEPTTRTRALGDIGSSWCGAGARGTTSWQTYTGISRLAATRPAQPPLRREVHVVVLDDVVEALLERSFGQIDVILLVVLIIGSIPSTIPVSRLPNTRPCAACRARGSSAPRPCRSGETWSTPARTSTSYGAYRMSPLPATLATLSALTVISCLSPAMSVNTDCAGRPCARVSVSTHPPGRAV